MVSEKESSPYPRSAVSVVMKELGHFEQSNPGQLDTAFSCLIAAKSHFSEHSRNVLEPHDNFHTEAKVRRKVG